MKHLALANQVGESVVDELITRQTHLLVAVLELLSDGVQRGDDLAVVELHDDQAERLWEGDELGLGDHLHLDSAHLTWKGNAKVRGLQK